MPASVADVPAGLPSLRSSNVRALGSVQSDKNELLHSYVRTQETYLASYASEGRAVMASWGVEPSSLSPQEHGASSLRNVEIESGFGTPLLKPRARITQPVAAQKRSSEEPQEKEPGKRIKNRPQNGAAARDGTSARPSHLENCTEAPRPARDRNGEPASKPLESSSVPKQVVLDPAHIRAKTRAHSKSTMTTKHSATEADKEHRARLAERKERRRVKRAIVEPKSKPPGSVSGDDSDGAQNPRTNSKGKKAKGLNIPAGLALLHGFSAVNVGKNRLTIRPDPLAGVFNKGRASAKASTKKDKPAKSAPTVKVFSEHSFLNKYRRRRSSSASQESPCDGGNIIIENIPTAKDSTRSGEARQFDPAGRKRARPVTDAPSSSEGASEQQQELEPGSSPAKKRSRTRRAESPVWDIELASSVLPSDADDSCAPVATEIAKVASTVVMDVREDTAKWTAVVSSQALESNPASSVDHAKPSQKTSSKASSIAPSQSASQAQTRHFDQPPDTASTVIFSKYFSAPAHSIPMVETSDLQDATAVSRLQPSSNCEQSAVGSAIGARFGFLVPDSQPSRTTTFDSDLPLAPTAPHCDADIPGYEETVDCLDAVDVLLPNSPLALESRSVGSLLSGPPSLAASCPPDPGFRASSFPISHDPPISDQHKFRHSHKVPRQRKRHRLGFPNHSRSAAYAFAASPEPHSMLTSSRPEACMGLPLDDSLVTDGICAYGRETCYLPDDSSTLGRWADISRNSTSFLTFDDGLDDFLASHDVPLPAEYEGPFPTLLGEGDATLLCHGYCNSGSSLLDASHGEQYEPYDMQAYFKGQPDEVARDLLDSTFDDAEAAVVDAHSEPLILAGADSSENALVWTSDEYVGFDVDSEAEHLTFAARFEDEATAMELEVAPGEDEAFGSASDLESEHEHSVLDSLQRFSQGRALLLGVPHLGMSDYELGAAGSKADLSKMEADVAKGLNGNWWHPQRF